MGLVVLVKKMSVLINFLLQNTNLVSVLSPNFAGHVWQDWLILRTLIIYKQTWNMLSKLDFSLFFIIKKSSYERNNFLMTDIFFTRTTKPICNFANSVVLMFNININYTTAKMDYAISARPSRTPIIIRGKSRWTQKSDRGNWCVVSSYKPRCPWWTAKEEKTLRVVIFLYSSRFVTHYYVMKQMLL
jgi:hypothetical protein